MKLHELQPAEGSKRKRNRVGRGIAAGQGKTAGRGTKGQGSRGGKPKGAGFEGGQLPLVRRLPFKRGFNNIFKIHYQEVNVGDLNGIAAGTTVTPELLEANGLIRDAQKPVKILGDGKLTTKLTVSAHKFSKSASEKIAGAGGTTEPLEMLVTGSAATVKLLTKEKLAALAEQKTAKAE